MKNATLPAQAFFKKIDLRAVLFGLLAMIVTGLALLGIMWVLVLIFDPDFFAHPHHLQLSLIAWLAIAGLIIASALVEGFWAARMAKQAPVLNAMIIPAVEIARIVLMAAIRFSRERKIVLDPVPLCASLANLALLIAFSYFGARLAVRFCRKTPPAVPEAPAL